MFPTGKNSKSVRSGRKGEIKDDQEARTFKPQGKGSGGGLCEGNGDVKRDNVGNWGRESREQFPIGPLVGSTRKCQSQQRFFKGNISRYMIG